MFSSIAENPVTAFPCRGIIQDELQEFGGVVGGVAVIWSQDTIVIPEYVEIVVE